MRAINKHLLLPVSLLLTGFVFSQNVNFENVQKAFENNQQENIFFELKKIDTTKISIYDKATWLFYMSEYQSNIDIHNKAYENAIKAKKLFKSQNAESDVADCNILLLSILEHQNNLELGTENIIQELERYALKDNDTSALISTYHRIAVTHLNNENSTESLKYFRKIINLYKLQRDTLKIAQNHMNVGTVFYSVLSNTDSSLYYTKKAEPVLKKYKDFQTLAYNYNNQAQQHKARGNYNEAVKYYLKADSIPLDKNIAKSKIIFYENMAEAYQLNMDYKNAALYLDKLNRLKDSINDTQQNIAISEIKEKYDNEKLRADNLESEAKRKQNQNIAIGLGGSLALGSIIAFLVFKNVKRKQKLAEQAKEIETQRLSTVLKEQELKAIDAMIEGQEKERQRIANDLHDDLGGMMATVKLHFDALKKEASNELYEKTNQLIDEAYHKVRTVAHSKNSGVMAKQGLLKAVQHLADTISASSKINIEVLDHGLNQRLENSLELTLFRIIQELVTNIIKHAQATEATIHITHHDDSINIMVEDNGKGFNPKQLTITKSGMGISSIDKRVEHLDGKLNIESETNKGTTVIIDIPL